MISSIFGKTKPINFIILAAFLLSFYVFVQWGVLVQGTGSWSFFIVALSLALLLFSLFVVDFIVKRNKLTENNSYAILFFCLLIVLAPEVLASPNNVFCHLFLLFALRRIISLRSLKEVKLKVFDATFWVLVSSLFNPLSLVFLLLVLVSIAIFEPKNIRNWLSMLPAFVSFLLMLLAATYFFGSPGFVGEHYHFGHLLELEFNWGMGRFVKLGLFVAVAVFLVLFSFLRNARTGVGKILSYRLLTMVVMLGLFMVLLAPSEGNGALLITFFPITVFATNAIEAIKREKMREAVLVGCVLGSFLTFVITAILV
ncbi:DUF6427 family protein [Maribacter sp. 2307ULW6-5]|uniref:DUF6427 family protein n=1 Tax=Maribacter sp. 2307ULW6-5 TaxID=3386275 RepID=UPI0039BD103B